MRTIDRVQAHTAGRVNRRIEDEARQRVLHAARESESRLSQRMTELDREWDIERLLEANASSLALSGVLLGLFVNRRFLAIPIVVLSFLFLHATQGWCPPIPILRRLGFRTRKEIDREKYALKALRGDFAEVPEMRKRHDIFASGSNAWNGAAG
jgi:hypothetical protein